MRLRQHDAAIVDGGRTQRTSMDVATLREAGQLRSARKALRRRATRMATSMAAITIPAMK